MPDYMAAGWPTPVAKLPSCDYPIGFELEIFYIEYETDCRIEFEIEIFYREDEVDAGSNFEFEIEIFHELGEESYRVTALMDLEIHLVATVDALIDDRFIRVLPPPELDNPLRPGWDEDGVFLGSLLEFEVDYSAALMDFFFQGAINFDLDIHGINLDHVHTMIVDYEVQIAGRQIVHPDEFIREQIRIWLQDPINNPFPPLTNVLAQPPNFGDDWLMRLSGLNLEIEITELLICTPLPLKWLSEFAIEVTHIPIDGHGDLDFEMEIEGGLIENDTETDVGFEIEISGSLSEPDVNGITCVCCSSPVPQTLRLSVENKRDGFLLIANEIHIAWDQSSSSWIGNNISLHEGMSDLRMTCTQTVDGHRWMLLSTQAGIMKIADVFVSSPFRILFLDTNGFIMSTIDNTQHPGTANFIVELM